MKQLSHIVGVLFYRSAMVVLLSSVMACATYASTFQLIYTGTFSSSEALNLAGDPLGLFTGVTPFTASAVFDDTSPNLAAPVSVPGFVSYSPVWATLNVGGTTYDFTTYNQDPIKGVTVAVFDNTTPFGPPGHYAIGFLQNPLADGAGFIGDFLSSTPPFLSTHIIPTDLTGYFGVGHGSGPDFGSGPTVVPIPLTSKGQSYQLTLGNYDETFFNGTPLNTAKIQAVPEPGMILFLSAGLGCVPFIRRRRS